MWCGRNQKENAENKQSIKMESNLFQRYNSTEGL